MVTREDVVAEIQKVPDKHLEALYFIIKDFEERSSENESNENVMAALRQIKIAASPDFSIKAKLYDLEERDAR
jgi:hypothetical protein